MLDFVDTNLFNKEHEIRVIVYSSNVERGKQKINSLIEGENIILKKERREGMEVIVNKNGLDISIMMLFLGHSARGSRTTYSVIDREILSMENGAELFYNIIRPANVVYSHILNDINKRPVITTMLF